MLDDDDYDPRQRLINIKNDLFYQYKAVIKARVWKTSYQVVVFAILNLCVISSISVKNF